MSAPFGRPDEYAQGFAKTQGFANLDGRRQAQRASSANSLAPSASATSMPSTPADMMPPA